MLYNQKGFSLIELLVVVAIIGVLAAAGVVGYQNYTDNAEKNVLSSNNKVITDAVSTDIFAEKLGIPERTELMEGVDLTGACQLVASAVIQKIKNEFGAVASNECIQDKLTAQSEVYAVGDEIAIWGPTLGQQDVCYGQTVVFCTEPTTPIGQTSASLDPELNELVICTCTDKGNCPTDPLTSACPRTW